MNGDDLRARVDEMLRDALAPHTEAEVWDSVDPSGLVRYFARDGRQISMREWSQLFEKGDYKRVAETNVGFWWVSTVWLGLDHSMAFRKGAPPIYFETVVFRRTDMELNDLGVARGLRDHLCERYGSEAAALAGHAAVVEAIRSGNHDLYDTSE